MRTLSPLTERNQRRDLAGQVLGILCQNLKKMKLPSGALFLELAPRRSDLCNEMGSTVFVAVNDTVWPGFVEEAPWGSSVIRFFSSKTLQR